MSPRDGLVSDNTKPLLLWNSVNGATSYQIELAQDVSFIQNYQTFNSLVNSYQIATPLVSGAYFWKISTLIGGQSYQSNVGTFTIFSPTDLSDLTLWLSSDSLVTLDVSNKVQQWGDLSSNAYSFAADIPSRRPTVSSGYSSLSNQSGIKFDGTQRLISSATYSFSDASIFMVGIQHAGEEGYGRFIDHGYNTGFWIGRPGSTDQVGGGFIESNPFGNYNPCSNDIPFELSYVRTGSATNYNYNGMPFTQPTRTTTGGATLSNKIYFGSDISNYAWGKKELFSVVIFNTDLTPSQRMLVEQYLMNKYAPPVSLGMDIIPNYTSNTFCVSETLSANFPYENYLWNTGQTTPSITVTRPGTYILRATDIFGRFSYDTVKVVPPFALNTPQTDVICSNTQISWATSFPPSDFSFNWSDGSTQSALSISSPGSYSVIISDNFGCQFFSDTLQLTLDNYQNVPFLGNDTTLCTGNPISLQMGADQTVAYSWQDGAFTTQTFYNVGPSGYYWVEASNENGCIGRDTIYITNVGTAPLADFNVDNQCFGPQANIQDQSTGVGADFVAQWQWDLGNGTMINQQNVNYTYPSPGVYPIELYVQSLGGCGAYHYDTIEVFANPTAVYTFSGHCVDQEVQFTDGTQAGSSPVTAYSWNFGIPATGSYNFSNIPIPNRIYDQVGTYNVKLVVTDGNGCKDSITQSVQIDPSPVPNFVFESTCQGTPIQFLNTSNTQASSTYLWDFGDNTSSILVNPQHTYPDYGINSVSLQITNLYNCSSTLMQEVEVYAFPLTSLQIGAACVDSYVTLENTSEVPLGAIDSTYWVINQTDTLYGANASWLVTSLGQQQVELFTLSAQGCAAQTSQFFDVSEQFNASFSTYPGIVAAGQPFTFENTSNPGSVALWTFGDGGFSTDFSPEHIFDAQFADSTLTVLLVALSPSGCVDSSYQEVLIQRERIDLEISNLFLQKDGNWYIMGVKLKNKGTVDLTGADLVVETPKGLLFNETWNGTLKPTEDSIYVFSAMPTSIFSDQDAIESYVCVSGQAHDLYGTLETYLDNNKVCKNVEGESIVLLPVFPNPIYKDFVVRIYLTNPAEVFLSLDDDRGRSAQVMENGNVLQSGYYEYVVDADKLAEGTYFVNLRSGDVTQSFKLSVVK